MSFSQELLDSLRELRLLNHPFYKAWEHGEVPLDTLKLYARQYYHHVEAFPRYLSATHSGCNDANARQEILRNLIDEELGGDNHPALWMNFAEGLGNSKSEVKKENLRPETSNLISRFMKASHSSYAEGVAALFMYEEQTPEIAHTKMEGLKAHYGISDAATLGYFALHKEMDIEHSAATGKLVDAIPLNERPQALRAARECAEALWGFLDGMQAHMQQ